MNVGPIAAEPDVRDNPAWLSSSIDIASCARLEINIPLYEFEKVEAVLFETWPADVRSYTMRIVNEWQAKNPARQIVAATHGVTKIPGRMPVCTTIVHHRAIE